MFHTLISCLAEIFLELQEQRLLDPTGGHLYDKSASEDSPRSDSEAESLDTDR